MKRHSFIVLSVLIVLPGIVRAELSVSSPLILIDQIDCVVCGPAYCTPLTDTGSTWKRVPFENENQFVPLQKQIQGDIVVQQVLAEKLPIDPSAIEKHVESIKKQLKINDAELADLFGQYGLTMAEGLEWIANQYTSEFFMHYKFKSQLVPIDDEIKAYFNEYPEFVDGWYELQIARVSYEDDDRDAIKSRLEQAMLEQATLEQAVVDHDDAQGLIEWGSPLKITTEDLASDQQFVTQMKVGDIRVHESSGMFELVKLIAHESTRIKSLEERRSSIMDTLNRKKLESMLQAYNESVYEFVDVIPLKAEIKEIAE